MHTAWRHTTQRNRFATILFGTALALVVPVPVAAQTADNEPADVPWDAAKSFDPIYAVVKSRGIEVEF